MHGPIADRWHAPTLRDYPLVLLPNFSSELRSPTRLPFFNPPQTKESPDAWPCRKVTRNSTHQCTEKKEKKKETTRTQMSFAQTLTGDTYVMAYRALLLSGKRFFQNLLKTSERMCMPTNLGRSGKVEKKKYRNEPSFQKLSTQCNDYPLYVTEARSGSIYEGAAL